MTILEKLTGIAVTSAAGFGVAVLLAATRVPVLVVLATVVVVMFAVAGGWVAIFQEPDR